MDEKERHSLGMQTRRTVLGHQHVDRVEAGITPFNSEFQDLITRLAWGEIWTRPGIDFQTRRLITIAMLIALNRDSEFKMHVRSALKHGVEQALIKEVILQSAVYCGIPAANAAFHQAGEVIDELAAAEAATTDR